MLNQQHVDVPRLKIEPLQRGYADHKKCIKLCLNDFLINSLSQTEKKCVINCLTKYRDSERYMVQKMHKVMTQQAMGHPQLKPLYDGVDDKAREIVGDKL